MRCRVCHSRDTAAVPFDIPPEAGEWVRCRACGSDSNRAGYDPAHYPILSYANDTLEYLRGDCRSNCDWYDYHHNLGGDRSFLDVGVAHGAVMDVMREMGWDAHGFDVAPPVRPVESVVVHPTFSRWLFPRRFAAVMCREVVEHVDAPHLLLHELHGACVPGGLVQVQTPIPFDRYHGNLYPLSHLFLASPAALKRMLHEAMLDVADERHWDLGQAYLCRARR